MLLDQAIKNTIETGIRYGIIGICCVVGIAVFIGVYQVLSGPSIRRTIGRKRW